MTYLVELAILPKKDILDPQGNAVGNAMRSMGYDVSKVRIGKYIKYRTNKDDEWQVRDEVKDITNALVSRGIIEFNTQTYEIHSINKLESQAQIG